MQFNILIVHVNVLKAICCSFPVFRFLLSTNYQLSMVVDIFNPLPFTTFARLIGFFYVVYPKQTLTNYILNFTPSKALRRIGLDIPYYSSATYIKRDALKVTSICPLCTYKLKGELFRHHSMFSHG